jgi:coatomer protein complex subunit alpha (xenin)
MAAQARQVLAACEKSPCDALQLNYDPRNPFDICSVTFTPIYRGNKVSEGRLSGWGMGCLGG